MVDIRPLIESIKLDPDGRRLRLRLKLGEGGSGRATEVLGALGFAPEGALALPCERTALHIKWGDGLRSPMEAF